LRQFYTFPLSRSGDIIGLPGVPKDTLSAPGGFDKVGSIKKALLATGLLPLGEDNIELLKGTNDFIILLILLLSNPQNFAPLHLCV
jgi:hypothetical protein